MAYGHLTVVCSRTAEVDPRADKTLSGTVFQMLLPSPRLTRGLTALTPPA
jgi:hypothetical protein